MSDLTRDLRQWRKDRNITESNTRVYVANVIEELLEIYFSDKDRIKHYQNKILDEYFDRTPISEEGTLDAIQDIQVFSINETEQMGYDNYKCNNEVYSEISSRRQCPVQKEDWDDGIKVKSEKWKKDINQDKDTLYKADYSICRLK